MFKKLDLRDTSPSKTVEVLVGTSIAKGSRLLSMQFNGFLWASDNLETVAHYYDGMTVMLTVSLDPKQEREFVASIEELEDIGETAETYGYGSALMRCPAGATWWSFSAEYLRNHVLSVTEVFPDLSPWQEE